MIPAPRIDARTFPYPERATLTTIPGGVAGTRATLAAMASHVKTAKADPRIRRLAVCIVGGLPHQAAAGDAYAEQICSWVADNIQFVRDVDGLETLTPPAYLLATRAGDCDDHVMLVASLLQSVGIPARFVVGGNATDRPEHVWAEASVDGEWVPCETTLPIEFGVAPPYRYHWVQPV